MPNREPPFRAIAESTYDWETWVDQNGRVRWTNAAVERFTGYAPGDCLELPDFPLSVVCEDDRPWMRALLEGALGGSSGNDLEFRVVHRDGSVRWAAISWQPLVEEGAVPRGYRTSVRDIDARKEVEERLRAAEREAARSAAERTEFLASLSHELRSPLHCIAGFAELLMRGELDDQQHRWVAIVGEQSRAVLRLVEDLLQFVAGERHALALQHETFDLAHLASTEVEAARARSAPGVLVRFTNASEGTLRVIGDVDRVRQILANLLTNAIRFTERGEVEVHVEARERDQLALVVRDTGIGMSSELLERIREPFVQGAPSSSASRGGVGLGLAIVDRLVRAMGGTLTFESHPGLGTRAEVVLSLPRAHPKSTEASDDPPMGLPVRSLRVLVVDDSAPARELIVAMLEDAGIRPLQASSGAEALQVAEAARPDLVLIDYHMPGLDGVGTAQRLRSMGAVGASTTIALLTANVLVEATAGTPPPGIDCVLTKPLRLARLRALLDEASARHAGESAEPLLDDEVLTELQSLRDAEGRSLLERRGPALLEALRDAFLAVADAADATTRAQAAHTLRGLAASLGAVALAHEAGRLEADGGATTVEAIAGRIDEVRALLERSERAIAAIVERAASGVHGVDGK